MARATLRTQDPAHIVERLRKGEVVGVLAQRDLAELVDQERVLVSAGASARAWGVVRLRKGVAFPDGAAAVEKLGEKIDPCMAAYHATSTEPVWFHPVAVVEDWPTRPAIQGEGVAVAKSDDLDALQQLDLEQLGVLGRTLDAHPDPEEVVHLAKSLLEEYQRRGEEPARLPIYKQIFGYPAGKSALADRLVTMMPPHKTYVEPFVGSGAVLFKKEKAEVEVVNDLDPEVAEAWRILSKLTAAQIEALGKRDWVGRADTYKRTLKSNPTDDVGKLYRFLYTTRFSYAKMRNRGFSPGDDGKLSTMPSKIEKLAPRAGGVRVHCGDYEKVCVKHDGPDTVFFFDPPYVGTETHVGESSFDESRFFRMLRNLKGKWLLTYGVGGELPKMLRDAGYKVNTVSTNRSVLNMRGTKGDNKLRQIISYNYDVAKLAKSFKPEELGQISDEALRARLDALTDKYEPGAGPQEDVVNDALFLLHELERRGLAVPDSPLVEAARALSKDDAYAAVAPSGEESGREITLDEVLDALGPAAIRAPSVFIVGGLANHGRTTGDIDILIRGPLDEETEHAVKFRIGRMLAAADPELTDRVQWLDDSAGGPYTNHVPIFDLVMKRREERVPIEMAAPLSKAEVELPDKPGQRPAVFQLHARGKSVHGDLRMQINDHAVGWTLPLQRAGVVPDINTVADLRKIADGFDLGGNRYLKPLSNGRVIAEPKEPQPLEWLKMDERVFEEGATGATVEEQGVLLAIARPKVEYGRQHAYFHEYFFSDHPWFHGVLYLRQIAGAGGAVEEQEAGRRTPEGKLFWTATFGKDLLPSILTTRAVRRGVMPPDGFSWIPQSLEKVVPAEYRYWTKKGAEARRLRDELVRSKYFTGGNVEIIGGQFRRVQKTAQDEPSELHKAEGYVAPKAVQQQAERAYFWRKEHGRGGTDVGVGMARKIKHGQLLSVEDLRRMRAYFARHEVDKKTAGWKPGEDGYPSAGRIAWGLWGGDPGRAWVNGVLRSLEKSSATPATAGFALLRQTWKGQTVERPGPSRTVYWLVWESDGGLHGFAIDGNPLEGSGPFTATHQAFSDQEMLDHKGPVEPGTRIGGVDMNPTKDTPSDLRVVDSGKLAVLEEEPGRYALSLNGEAFRGVWEIGQEEKGAEIWTVRRTAEAPARKTVSKADVPTRDGVQIWDPKRKEPDVDREQMRPLAIFAPQKPRDQHAYTKSEELISDFVTTEQLRNGYGIEPKWNGRVVVVEKDASGKVIIFFEDTHRDRAEYFPTIKASAEKIKKPFIFVGELIDHDEEGNPLPRRELARFGQDKVHDDSRVHVKVWAVLYWDDENFTAKSWEERRSALAKALPEKSGVLVPSPARVAKSLNAFKAALKWAQRIPSSEGAMVSLATGTYSLGGHTSSVAKLKTTRIINAIVYDKVRKKPAPQQKTPARTYVYRCAVGPLTEAERERMKETVEIDGKFYTPLGETFATNVDAEKGDVLRVEVTEILVVDSDKTAEITWFTPMVQERVSVSPATVSQVRELALAHEIRKLCKIIKRDDERRFFLAVALGPNDGEAGAPWAPDADEHVYSREEVELAAWAWFLAGHKLGFDHQREALPEEMVTVESHVVRGDHEINGHPVREGDWLVGALVLSDEAWAKAKHHEYAYWSIEGDGLESVAFRPDEREAAA